MVKAKTKKKPKKKRRIKLDPAERIRRRIALKFKSDIRTSFKNCGFVHIPTRDHSFIIEGREGEIDALFVYKNIIVLTEDTVLKQDKIYAHLVKKGDYFRHLDCKLSELIDVLKKEFPKFKRYLQRNRQYLEIDYKFRYIYCTLNHLEEDYKKRYNDICYFLDHPSLKYFFNLSKTVHKSARFEFFKFLDLELKDIGVQSSGSVIIEYDGLLLPETASSFPSGHRLVSFLVEPSMLLEQAYVLRTDGWRDPDCLYQRLLSKSKIMSMRKYLVKEKRVFINNIIATLPTESIPKDDTGKRIGTGGFNTIKQVKISIPKEFNTIGIIDGQHRLYSYHEGQDNYDKAIDALRKKQHLLITGIVYPKGITEARKRRFEAKLFLEINDKQKRVKGDLKQSIEVIINPFSPIGISKAVILGLAEKGPLAGKLEIHFYDEGKIKTTSIVSYGLRHVVGLEGENSLFKMWRGKGKAKTHRDRKVLANYIEYCINEINKLLSGFKSGVGSDLWITNKKLSRALTTTTLNGLIFCLRKLIENNKINKYENYLKPFEKMEIDFSPENFEYKSSHWKDLGEKIYEDCF